MPNIVYILQNSVSVTNFRKNFFFLPKSNKTVKQNILMQLTGKNGFVTKLQLLSF